MIQRHARALPREPQGRPPPPASTATRFVELARKVVGVGSVGTRAWIVLLTGRDDEDPLFLQAKEAEASVLEPYAGASEFDNHGERVVEGQWLMQAASDIFLGWCPGAGHRRPASATSTCASSGMGRDRPTSRRCAPGRWRSTRGSAAGPWPAPTPAPAIGSRSPPTSARARSSTRSIADFSELYADQNEQDHAALLAAIDSGRVAAEDA